MNKTGEQKVKREIFNKLKIELQTSKSAGLTRGGAERSGSALAQERPILMNGDMVRALLSGRKTQTRRVIKSLPLDAVNVRHNRYIGKLKYGTYDGTTKWGVIDCPYGTPHDLLYVKEAAWMWCERRPNGKTKTGRAKWLYVPMREAQVFYCAEHPDKPALDVVSPDTGNQWGWRKKIGRFLPRWASRITLEIVSVKVERVQEISEADAVAEGIYQNAHGLWSWSPNVMGAASPVFAFQLLWDSINKTRGFGWDKNPWVWIISMMAIGAAGKSKEEIK